MGTVADGRGLAEVGVLMTGVLQYRAFSQHPAGGNELVVRHFNPRTEVSFCGHPVALRPRGLAGAAATG